MITPIETIYRGYRFRSRLEARWAVFFDHLGMQWEYEPEGYVLADGSRYLPDFFLPRFNGNPGLYVEVKALDATEGIAKAKRFAMEGSRSLLFAVGVPSPRHFDFIEDGKELDGIFTSKYLGGGRNGDEYRLYVLCGCSINARGECEAYDEIVTAACDAAKSARFEHGETP